MIKTQGIILKKASLNEVDQLLCVYTKKLGKVNISAKGTKKIESKLRYSIEPISLVQFILVQGKNSLILKDAIIKDQFLNIKKDFKKIEIIEKILNIIDEAIVGQEKDEDIWQLILLTFKSIDKDKINLKTIIFDFQKNLIQLLGYSAETKLEDIY